MCQPSPTSASLMRRSGHRRRNLYWGEPASQQVQMPTGPVELKPLDGVRRRCPGASLVVSFATLGRLDFRSACHHCAVDARYANPPLRVAAFRRSSREIVDGARARRRAISRTLKFWACSRAISSRSAKDGWRPESGVRLVGGMPPFSRNHRVPIGCETPASRAASQLR
jgi:hypothetical protein